MNLESNSPDIFVLCQTNYGDSGGSDDFFGTDYLSLISKDSVNQIHGLAIYLKEVLLLHVTCPLKIQMILMF